MLMYRSKSVIISSFLIIIFFGCSNPRLIHSESVPGENLSAYKTFDFYTTETAGDMLTKEFSEVIPKLENTIALQMQKYGYLMTKTDPDLLINIGLVVDEKVQTRQTDFRRDTPQYIGQRRYSWKSEEVEVSRYKQGTVTVDLVDRKQNKMVWNATVQDVLPTKASKLDKSIKDGVEKLFERFPVQKIN